MTINSIKETSWCDKSMDLVVQIYSITKFFPKDERFGLTTQLRRAAVSIPSNVAEGHGRLGRPDFRRFLCIARGSLLETETQLQIAFRLGYLSEEQFREVNVSSGEVGRMLNGLLRALERDAVHQSSNGHISEEPGIYDADWPLIPHP